MERGREEHGTEGAAQGGSSWVTLNVEVGYDDTSKVYYVISSDIPGLNIETPTFDAFVDVAVDAAPDLLIDIGRPTRITFKQVVELTPSDGR